MNSENDGIATLTFKVDPKKNLTSKYKDLLVFIDNDNVNDIKDGDTWICSIEFNQKGRCWYAKGLKKVDAEFLFDLRSDQKETIARSVYTNCRDLIDPLANELGLEKPSVDELPENKKLKAENTRLIMSMSIMESKITGLETELDDMRAAQKRDKRTPDEMKTVKEYKATITCLQKRAEETVSELSALCEERAKLETLVSKLTAELNRRDTVKTVAATPVKLSENVMYLGSDELYYGRFSDGRYDVKMSVDHSIMVASPNLRGKVECTKGSMVLSGLDDLIGESGKRMLATEVAGDVITMRLNNICKEEI
jgi:hypothetical protein